MRSVAVVLAFAAIVVALVVAAAVVHSALLVNGAYSFEVNRRGAELAAGALLAAVLLASAFLLAQLERRDR